MKNFRGVLGGFIFLVAFGFRAWNIGVDLPNLYHPDEPHHLNIAARFGSGDLNPHDFKYPTLWPYMISVVFGILFVIQRVSGSIDGVTAFAVQYVTDPTWFYVAVRLFAAALMGGASLMLYRLGRRYFDLPFAISIGLLSALSPTLLAYGREGTHYPAMLFLVACILSMLCEVVYGHSKRKAFLIAAFLCGLAVSVHYVAAPMVLLLFITIWFAFQDQRSFIDLGLAGAVVVAGFLAGSPFVVVEWARFYADVSGIGELQKGTFWNESQLSFDRFAQLLKNLMSFIDQRGAGFLLAAFAMFIGWRKKERSIFIWVWPTVMMFPVLALLYFGSLERYALAIYYPLFIPAAYGFSWCWNRFSGAKNVIMRLVLVVVFVPSLMRAIEIPRALRLPDTRTQAKTWIETHVEKGARLFIMEPYKCPQLSMNKDQIKRLHERTQAQGHARAEYYRLKLLGAPDGGYEIFYLKRTVHEVQDIPHRTETSYLAQDAIDVKSLGLDALRQAGIDIVVINPVSDQDPNSAWIEELKLNSTLVMSFTPEPGISRGMPIEIYRVNQRENK